MHHIVKEKNLYWIWKKFVLNIKEIIAIDKDSLSVVFAQSERIFYALLLGLVTGVEIGHIINLARRWRLNHHHHTSTTVERSRICGCVIAINHSFQHSRNWEQFCNFFHVCGLLHEMILRCLHYHIICTGTESTTPVAWYRKLEPIHYEAVGGSSH